MIEPQVLQRTAFALAIHEAAHACVASIFKAPVDSVSIRTRPDQSGLDGEAMIAYATLSDRDALVVTFAGVAADSLLGDNADDDTEGDESDAARLKEIAVRFGINGPPEFYSATRRAERLVAQLQFEIVELARALAAAPFIDDVATISGTDLAPFLPGPRYSPW